MTEKLYWDVKPQYNQPTIILLLEVNTVPFTFHVCIAMQDAYY